MSVIGYFTTSPVVLMRRWEPELTPLCEVCNNWLAENDSFSSTTVFYYLCDGECTQSSFVLQSLEFAYFCNCDDCGSPASSLAALTNQNTNCTTTTTTTTNPPTTTTTTTIDCNQVYEIDVYGSSSESCYLCNSCGIGDCAECDVIQLEYSTDGGTNWNAGGIYFDTVSSCTYLGTFNIGICETTLIFRIISQNRCSGPIYFNYTAESSDCPKAENCGDCTDSETINVMPTGNTSIAFSICTECFNNCCSPCCV